MEPNDTPKTANPMVAVMCGSVTSATDLDNFTLTLGPKVRSLSIGYLGAVRIVITVDDKRIELTAPDHPQVPVRKNAAYLFEVSSPDGQPHDYKLTITES